jgi:hypothetical protein
MTLGPIRLCSLALLILLGPIMCPSPMSAIVRPGGTRASSDFGLDSDLGPWSLGYGQAGSQGLIINTMTVCSQFDVEQVSIDGQSVKRCASGNYMFLFQIPYAPDNLAITFNNLQGFDGADTSWGFMACSDTVQLPPDYFVQTTVALCTPDHENILYSNMNVDVQIPAGNGSLTLSFAPFTDPNNSLSTTRFPNGGITIFIKETTDHETSPLPPPTPGVGFTGTTGITFLPLDAREASDGGTEPVYYFGSVQVGKQSTTQSVVLFNSGLVPLNFYYFNLGTSFSVKDTCPTTLAPQESCTFFVTFIPTSNSGFSGGIQIYHDDPALQGDDYQHHVTFAGYGDSSPVTLSDSMLDFGSEPVSTQEFPATGSPSQVIQVVNPSSGSSVTLSSAFVTANVATGYPDFSAVASAACGVSTPGAVCQIEVTANPRLLGPTEAWLYVIDSNNDYHFCRLRTVGSSPHVLLDPSNATFPAQSIDTLSPTSAAFVGPESGFVPDAAFPVSAASGGFSVGFSPVVPGKQKGFVHIFTSVSTGADVAYFAGEGLGPLVSLSAPSISFGKQLWGTTSGAHPVVLTNTGLGILGISDITITGANSGEFLLNHDCGATVAPSASCTLSVTFSPEAAGPRKSVLTIVDNAPGSPHKVALTGNGVTLGLNPLALNFPLQGIGTQSAPLVVTATNLGSTPVHVWQVAVTGVNATEFIPGNTCPVPPATLAGGSHCQITIVFSPSGLGARSAFLKISHDGGGSPSSVALSGSGDVAVLAYSPQASTTRAGNYGWSAGGSSPAKKKKTKSKSASSHPAAATNDRR